MSGSVDADAIIVGGGIAGLAAGVELLDRGREPLVLEAGDEPGGHFRAERRDGYLFPWGPHAIPGFATEAFDFLDRLGLAERVLPARSGSLRWIWRDGRRVALPTGPGAFLRSPFLSLRGKLRLLSEPWRRPPRRPDPEESVAAFFTRRLGAEAARALVGPFVTGIYAGDPEALEARSAFPKLVGWEREAGSLVRGALAGRRRGDEEPAKPRRRGLFSLPGGLAEAAEAAAALLDGRMRLGCAVRAVARDGDGWRVETDGQALRARSVVLAVPPPAAGVLLGGVDAEAAELALGVPMAPVAVVHLGGPVPSGTTTPEGFGLLVPREAGLRTLGTVFSSALFPHRAPEDAWLQATYLGGVTDPGLLDREDDDLRRIVAEESRSLLGFDPDAGVVRIYRHRAAIPQLVRGHADRVAALRERLAGRPGLHACGNWLTGVGLEHAIESGRRAALEAAP